METQRWQVETSAAQLYEDWLVPALMHPWAPRLLDAARVGPGQRVLDVACGTGIVARLARKRVGPYGSVTGLDLNPEMLGVADQLVPDIDWQQGDAADLPFLEGRFERVLCQFGLMFFPDRVRALAEMHRVLEPGGIAGVATWGAIEDYPPYLAQARIAREFAGQEAEDIVRSPFALPDLDEVAELLRDAGFVSVEARRLAGESTYPDPEAFNAAEVDATPLGAHLHAIGGGTYGRLVRAMRDWLTTTYPGGCITFATSVNMVTGRKD